MKSRSPGAAAAARALLVVAVVAAQGCAEATEIRVSLTTDAPCETVRDVAIGAGAPGTTVGVSGTTEACVAGTIGDIVVVPSGEKDALVEIVVKGSLRSGSAAADVCVEGTAGCIVARRRIRFQRHTATVLPIALRAACSGVHCQDANDTCINGACVPSLVDVALCTAGTCDDDHLSPRPATPPAVPPSPPPAPPPPPSGTPQLLYKTGREPLAIAVDGGYLYWAERTAGHLVRALASGADTPHLLYDTGRAPASIAVGNAILFAGGGDTVWALPVAGGSVLTHPMSSTTQIASVALDPLRGFLYTGEVGVPNGHIAKVPTSLTSDGDAVPGRTFANPFALAIDATNLYYVESAGHTIGQIALDGTGGAVPLDTQISGPQSLAVLATGQLVIATNTTVVLRDPSTGAEVPLPAPGNPQSLVSDGAAAYYLERDAGTISRVKGGVVTVLASGIPFDPALITTQAVAVDAGYVYYTVSSKDEIWRVPK